MYLYCIQNSWYGYCCYISNMFFCNEMHHLARALKTFFFISVGNEERGISSAVMGQCSRAVFVPGADIGLVDSPGADPGLVDSPSADIGLVDSPSADTGLVNSPGDDTGLVDSPGADIGLVDSPGTDTGLADLPSADNRLVNSPSAKTGLVDSLNVSVATGIIIYHVVSNNERIKE